MAPLINMVAPRGTEAPALIIVAVAVAVVLGGLTRLVKALVPGYHELQKTKRTAIVERERTRRASGLTISSDDRQIVLNGPAPYADPQAAAEALRDATDSVNEIA